MTQTTPVTIDYYSDLLCVWAYAAEARLDEVRRVFGSGVRIELKLCSVFGDTAGKIARQWKDRGGYEGFNRHVLEVAAQFDRIDVHPEVWLTCRPATSDSAHLFVRAVGVAATRHGNPGANDVVRDISWRLRQAFFRDNRDIALSDVHFEEAEYLGLDAGPIEEALRDGSAHAALRADYNEKELHKIEGSPTLLMNHGRQKIYGNVGYRVIEANVRELMRTRLAGEMSWC